MIMLLTRYNGTPMYTHTLTGKYHVLPHIFEDVFFSTSLAAEPLLLNRVVQVAECDSWSSFLEILLNTTNNLFPLRHLETQQGYRQGERKGVPESGVIRARKVQSDSETCAVCQRETGEQACNQWVSVVNSSDLWTPQSVAHRLVAFLKKIVWHWTFPPNVNKVYCWLCSASVINPSIVSACLSVFKVMGELEQKEGKCPGQVHTESLTHTHAVLWTQTNTWLLLLLPGSLPTKDFGTWLQRFTSIKPQEHWWGWALMFGSQSKRCWKGIRSAMFFHTSLGKPFLYGPWNRKEPSPNCWPKIWKHTCCRIKIFLEATLRKFLKKK